MRIAGCVVAALSLCVPLLRADEAPRVQSVRRMPLLPSIVLPLGADTGAPAGNSPDGAAGPALPFARPLPSAGEPTPARPAAGAESVEAPEPLNASPADASAESAPAAENSIQSETEAKGGAWPDATPLRLGGGAVEPAAAVQALAPSAEELVAAMLAPRPDSAATGAPVDLQRTLTSTLSPAERAEALAAYWSLVESLASYHAALDYAANLARVPASTSPSDEALRRTALAAAAARAQQAALRLSEAQYDLIQWLRVAPDAPLPLPADRPFVGAYRTSFDDIFRGRAVSWRVRAIDRILPVRRHAVEAHTAAVTAARDAWTATLAACEVGQAPVADLLAAGDDLRRREAEFMAAVCQYNRETSEYALAAAPAGVAPQELVARIIVPAAASPLRDGAVQQASGTESSRPDGWQPAEPKPSAAPPATLPEEATAGGTPLNMPAETSSAQPDANAPSADAGSSILRPIPQRVRRAELGLYPALVDMQPARQAHELALALTSGAGASQAVPGKPLTLADALGHRTGDRLAVVRAYWTAAQRLAEYEAISQEQGMLETLAFSLESAPPAGGGEEARRQLAAARAASEAALQDAKVRLIEAQHELASLAGWSFSTEEGPLPSTAPHCGPYLLKLEKQRPEAVQTWSVRRLASLVPARHEALARQAAVVVEADAARAELTAERESGALSTAAVLRAIEQQTAHTQTFLQALADYNSAIAEYVVQVVPDTLPADRLAAALVTPGQ